MPPTTHPDDERLAAYAAAETDAMNDAALASHVNDCSRCTLLLADLRSIQSALSQLPDMPPPRPLRLLPPVPGGEVRATGWSGFLRRLSAPLMGVAVILILVGAVGSSGALRLAGSAAFDVSASAAGSSEERSAATPSEANIAPGAGGAYQATPSPSAKALDGGSSSGAFGPKTGGQSAAPAASTVPAPASDERLNVSAETLYPWILGAGVVLLATGFLARAATRRPEDEG